jgi:heptosyltransferase-3
VSGAPHFPLKFLVIRRDNIGDLVHTTPVFRALRERFPGARIDAFVNSYNAPILEGHPDVDQVHAYTKGKHRNGLGRGWLERFAQLVRLRRERYDHVLVATPGIHVRQIRTARFIRPAHITAFVPPGWKLFGVDQGVEYASGSERHHVELTFRILEPFAISGEPPPPRIAFAPEPRAPGAPPTVAVHVSARKPSSRWPEENFAPLMRAIHERHGARFRLFWAPGAEDDPRHPGDDAKARRILEAARGLPVEPCETGELRALVSGLAGCDAIVCSDGGAMHIAAAQGLPVVCFFGDSDARRWRPWAVPHRVLQPESRDVRDVSVEAALDAFDSLATERPFSAPGSTSAAGAPATGTRAPSA